MWRDHQLNYRRGNTLDEATVAKLARLASIVEDPAVQWACLANHPDLADIVGFALAHNPHLHPQIRAHLAGFAGAPVVAALNPPPERLPRWVAGLLHPDTPTCVLVDMWLPKLPAGAETVRRLTLTAHPNFPWPSEYGWPEDHHEGSYWGEVWNVTAGASFWVFLGECTAAQARARLLSHPQVASYLPRLLSAATTVREDGRSFGGLFAMGTVVPL